MRLAFDEWTPDQPSLGGGADKAFNVLPAAQSYRPVSSLVVYSTNGFSARVQGSGTFKDTSGNVNAFAMDATAIKKLASSGTWSDVSAATYATPSDQRVVFAQYGNQVVATNYADAVQLYTMGTSALFAALSVNAPKAKCAVIAKNQLILGNTNDTSDGAVPYRLWASVQGDITDWPTIGSQDAVAGLSWQEDLAGDGGEIFTLTTGVSACTFLVFQEQAVIRGLWTGNPNQPYDFDLMEGAAGVPCKGGVAVANSTAFYLGQNGFYATDGMTAVSIGGQKVDNFFWHDTTYGVDVTNLHRISAVVDPVNKVVMWGYPSVSGSGGNLDCIICFNYETKRWSLITSAGDLDLLTQSYAVGYTLEGLDAVSSSIDALPYSLDSREYTAGNLLLGAYKTDHMLYTFTGSYLAATLTVTEQSHPSGQRMQVNEVWPLVDGSSATITFTPYSRNRQNDAVVVGSSVAQNSTGCCSLRVNARYLGGAVNIAAAGTWTHAIGVDIPDNRIVTVGFRDRRTGHS
jgi:hypothetical protein